MKEPDPRGYQIESVWSLVALVRLVEHWRATAAEVDDDDVRQTYERLAWELEQTLQATFDEAISPEQLAAFSGHSVRQVREWLEAGLLPDIGYAADQAARRREIVSIAEQRSSEVQLFRKFFERLAPSESPAG